MIRSLVQLIGSVALRGSHEWAQAMQAEIDAIADTRAARRYSLGCLWAALIFRLRVMADAGASVPGDGCKPFVWCAVWNGLDNIDDASDECLVGGFSRWRDRQ